MSDIPSETLRRTWLDALLPLAAERGWNDETLAEAANAAGLDEGEQALAAPKGVIDLIDGYFRDVEAKLADHLAAADLEALRVHERVAHGVRTWLDLLAPHRAAVIRAGVHVAAPWRADRALAGPWRVADTVWTGIGDTSEDYNYYSKRSLLTATLPPILLYWQTGPEDAALDRFIAGQLRTAMQVGKTGGQVFGPLLSRIWPAKEAPE